MKLFKNIILIVPVRLAIKLLETCFILDCKIFKCKYHFKIVKYYEKVVKCKTNKWFWEIFYGERMD